MSRVATLIESTGVGSYHVGLKDLNGPERRATFQFASNSPFGVELFATQDFDFGTSVGTNWIKVTDRIFLGQGDLEAGYAIVGGSLQRTKPKKGIEIGESGIYAFDDGFMPAALSVQVTSITSGSPVKILFGV